MRTWTKATCAAAAWVLLAISVMLFVGQVYAQERDPIPEGQQSLFVTPRGGGAQAERIETVTATVFCTDPDDLGRYGNVKVDEVKADSGTGSCDDTDLLLVTGLPAAPDSACDNSLDCARAIRSVCRALRGAWRVSTTTYSLALGCSGGCTPEAGGHEVTVEVSCPSAPMPRPGW